MHRYAARPVVVCGSLRWSAVVCGFQIYRPQSVPFRDRSSSTVT